MTMSFPIQENFGFVETVNQLESVPVLSQKQAQIKEAELHICSKKIRVPEFEKSFRLPRLTDLLAKSANQFGATLITGRSGTGKTALAADFARRYETVAWYSIESADCDWSVFSAYLAAGLLGESFDRKKFSENLNSKNASQQTVISRYLTNIFLEIGERCRQTPVLIVLDDLHHIFDCDWFSDFFNLLLYSLPSDAHLLLLCRSKPALPLWRLRSKQVLNVIDEKLLALNFDETEELYKNFGLSKENAGKAYRDSFGRISKLMNLAKTDSAGGGAKRKIC